MNCLTCKVNKIGPVIEPFGGYFCSNEHLQCNECNFSWKGQCGVCEASTKFLQMKLNSPKSSSEPLSTAPQTSICSKEQPSFSKQFFEEIETQSRLSKEYLSMKDSKELDIKKESNDNLAIEGNLNENKNCVKTLFMNTSNTHNSLSGIGFNDHQETAEVENANELPKFESEKTPTFFTIEHMDMKKGNAFTFHQNVNNSSIINLSEIRFMDSSDSLKNLYTNSKGDVSNNNGKQANSLSVEVLRDFEIENSTNRKEVVNKYLESYSPKAISPCSGFSCQPYQCNFEHQTRKPKVEISVRTVSVSTESDPSLKSTSIDEERANYAANLKPHNFFIMPAVGATSTLQQDSLLLDKINKSSVDLRMQKVLETLKEDSKETKFFEQPHLIKIPTLISTKEPDIKEHFENRPLKREDKNAAIFMQLINTHRAFYNPPNPFVVPVNNLHTMLQTQPVQQEPPLPQFQTVPCSPALSQELVLKRSRFLNLKPVTACMLNIPRSPIQCPESACQRMIFISDFNKHLVVDHTLLPMERITPFQCKNFFLDARLAHCGTSKCHLLYLMRDKIKDLGSSEYKDFLPILIMTSRISLNQICGLRNQTSDLEYFLIWVTGIASEEFPISVSLTIWSRSGRVPACHIVYSGQMYSIRNSQNALDVWQSGRMLLLSAQEINALTSNGKEMLNLQLSVH